MTFRCACGREIAGPGCPACGALYDLRPGWRAVRCACGATALAAPGQVGTSIPCAGCFLRVAVPPDAPPAPPVLKRPPRGTSTAVSGGIRDRLRWLFPLTLLPLLIHTFHAGDEPSVRDLMRRAVEENPVVVEPGVIIATVDDLFRVLRIERVEGAFHSRFTGAHWLYAALAAAGFWALIVGLFPLGRANSLHLWTVGLLIGTGGILLLLGLHRLPFVKVMYDAAFGETGFVTSLVGYTLGIGVCEELVKLLPLAVVFRKGGTLDVRGAVAWGLAMGAGFGVSEAVFFSANAYNGLRPGGIYVVRFVSVVALHMAWSGTAAAWLWTRRDEIGDAEHAWSGLWPMLTASAGSILLHGLYDGFLKFGVGITALCVAALSFVYFFWSVDRKLAEERG
ncbi:MAG TPA: hypothetical protein VF950_21570 [Planctomycetota bacterium]